MCERLLGKRTYFLQNLEENFFFAHKTLKNWIKEIKTIRNDEDIISKWNRNI